MNNDYVQKPSISSTSLHAKVTQVGTYVCITEMTAMYTFELLSPRLGRTIRASVAGVGYQLLFVTPRDQPECHLIS